MSGGVFAATSTLVYCGWRLLWILIQITRNNILKNDVGGRLLYVHFLILSSFQLLRSVCLCKKVDLAFLTKK